MQVCPTNRVIYLLFYFIIFLQGVRGIQIRRRSQGNQESQKIGAEKFEEERTQRRTLNSKILDNSLTCLDFYNFC
jgi:hypothetical protein